LTKKSNTNSSNGSGGDNGKYVPQDQKIYGVTAEGVTTDLGSWWQLGSTEVNLANAEYCTKPIQQFKFHKIADTKSDRATYRIQNCGTGLYLTANGTLNKVQAAALDTNNPLQIWEIVQYSPTSTVHPKVAPTNDSTTIGVFAINNLTVQKSLQHSSGAIVLGGYGWQDNINQRWSIQLLNCTVSC
jgi:hypothetical protein